MGRSERKQWATALENTALMRWTRDEIDDLIKRQPKLGMALIQILVERCFAGTDSRWSRGMRWLRHGDTLVAIDPNTYVGRRPPDLRISTSGCTLESFGSVLGGDSLRDAISAVGRNEPAIYHFKDND